MQARHHVLATPHTHVCMMHVAFSMPICDVQRVTARTRVRAEHGARVVQLGRDGSLPAARDRCVDAARVLQVRLEPEHLMTSTPAASPRAALPPCASALLGSRASLRLSALQALTVRLAARREVYGQHEYAFHVYKELMWGEEAGAPLPGPPLRIEPAPESPLLSHNPPGRGDALPEACTCPSGGNAADCLSWCTCD